MKLAVPLHAAQIEAAGRLRGRLQQWQVSDAALERLADLCPSFNSEETLLKVVAINGLYGTNVYAQVRMAQHITNVVLGADLEHVGPELVELMACLPSTEGQRGPRRHVSFASKFAHFFLNAERFPIFDRYALTTVQHHLGRHNCVKSKSGAFVTFVANIQRLKQLCGLDIGARELDRYLWLAGLYRHWQQTKDSRINREAIALFTDDCSEVRQDLELLAAGDE